MTPDNRESNALFRLAATLGFGGVVLFLIVLISGLKALPDRLPSQQFPGSLTLEFHEVGTVVVFVETEETQEDWDDAALQRLFESLSIKVVGPEGRELQAHSPQSKTSYNLGVRKGRALATFPAPVEGPYEVSVEFRHPGEHRPQVLSFGLNFGAVLLRLILSCFFAFALPSALAVLVAVSAIRKRKFAPPDRSLHQSLVDRFESAEVQSGIHKSSERSS